MQRRRDPSRVATCQHTALTLTDGRRAAVDADRSEDEVLRLLSPSMSYGLVLLVFVRLIIIRNCCRDPSVQHPTD